MFPIQVTFVGVYDAVDSPLRPEAARSRILNPIHTGIRAKVFARLILAGQPA